MNYSINQSINQLINQWVNQSIDKSLKRTNRGEKNKDAESSKIHFVSERCTYFNYEYYIISSISF